MTKMLRHSKVSESLLGGLMNALQIYFLILVHAAVDIVRFRNDIGENWWRNGAFN